MKTTYEEWREITNQNNKQKSVSISSLLWRLLPLLKLITILHRARVIDATIFVHSINLSSMFLFFLLPVPLCNSSTSLFTAVSLRAAVFPPSRTATATSSPPMPRAYAPVFPASAFMIMVSFIMPSSMAMM